MNKVFSLLLIFSFVTPSLVFAANDEASKVACLDELAKFEFNKVDDISPASFGVELTVQLRGSRYDWDGNGIERTTFVTSEDGFTSTENVSLIWTHQRSIYDGSGLFSQIATQNEIDQVLTQLIFTALADFAGKVRNDRKYNGFSIADTVAYCGVVDGVRRQFPKFFGQQNLGFTK